MISQRIYDALKIGVFSPTFSDIFSLADAGGCFAFILLQIGQIGSIAKIFCFFREFCRLKAFTHYNSCVERFNVTGQFPIHINSVITVVSFIAIWIFNSGDSDTFHCIFIGLQKRAVKHKVSCCNIHIFADRHEDDKLGSRYIQTLLKQSPANQPRHRYNRLGINFNWLGPRPLSFGNGDHIGSCITCNPVPFSFVIFWG